MNISTEITLIRGKTTLDTNQDVYTNIAYDKFEFKLNINFGYGDPSTRANKAINQTAESSRGRRVGSVIIRLYD